MVIIVRDTQQKPGYKQTEVGVVPEDWQVKRLEELGSWKGGATPSMANADFWIDGTIYWASSGDVKTSILSKTASMITENAVRQSSTTLLKEGAILIVTRSGILRKYLPVAKNTVRMAINQDIKALIPNNQVSVDYLLQMLSERGPNILSTCMKSGTTVESVEYIWLKKYSIPLPPLPEQQAIATALSDVDTLIASLDRLIAKKRDIKQAAMQQLLTGRTRLAGFSEEWEVKMLCEVANISRGASPRPIEDPKWFNELSGVVGWVRISDVTKSAKYLSNTTQYLSEQGVKQSHFVKKENLIMSICATIGKPIIVKMDVCIHDGFVIFERPKLNTEYLFYYLSLIENSWAKNGQTGSQMNLNTIIIENETISFPNNPEEQQAIAAVLSDMDTEIVALERKREKIRALKQAMMQELLTGKTRLL